MGALQRVTRTRHLTAEEAARDDAVRQQVIEEIPPVPPPLVRRAVKLLRTERERQKLTQAQVAEKAGLSREVICRLENQPGNAAIGTLERYARGLDVALEITLVAARTAARKRTA